MRHLGVAIFAGLADNAADASCTEVTLHCCGLSSAGAALSTHYTHSLAGRSYDLWVPGCLISEILALCFRLNWCSEGIEAMLEAAESVPHNEKHPVVQQLIETQRSQLQAEG